VTHVISRRLNQGRSAPIVSRVQRRTDEKGATLVETAVVIVIFTVLMFGILEFGFLFKDWNSASSGAKEAARLASTVPMDASMVNDTVNAVKAKGNGVKFNSGDQIQIVRVNGATGVAASCASGATQCRVYQWNRSAFTGVSGTTLTLSTLQTCYSATGTPALDSIGVKLIVHHKSLTGFFPDHTFTVQSVVRIEPQKFC
jgi:Flp pilus assembly protein TadG